MRIFVDVGSHQGQTLEEVTKDRWAFDVIHAIEPMPREFAIVRERFGKDRRLRLHPWALWDRTWPSLRMYGTNDELEASPFRAKVDVDREVVTEVPCTSATEFFKLWLPADAELIVNMNCEGSEVNILADLVGSGAILRITALLVSFDIAKVPGRETAEAHVRRGMASVGFDRFTSEYPNGETHQEQIAAWLTSVG